MLHSLLEPSYLEKREKRKKEKEAKKVKQTISVVGISNWRLDNSKSSRALLVQRYDFFFKINY